MRKLIGVERDSDMTPTLNSDLAAVLDVIEQVTGVRGLSPDQDFYEAGVTSVMALPLLLDLEERFEVTIPDDEFITARTARTIVETIAQLRSRA
jgi:acyl carrier protein